MAPRKSRRTRQARSVSRSPVREGTPLTEATPAGTATVVTDARFTLVKMRGIESTSPEFQDKVVQIAERLGTNPNFLMAVMSFETGGTFDPSVRNKAGSGAVGLIQFMPQTAQGLGTSSEALASMTAEEQLEFVERHYRPFKGRLGTLEDTYMAVLLPKAVGKGPDVVLFERPSVAFNQNKGLDTRELVILLRRRFPDLTILFNDLILVGDGLTKRAAGHDNHLHLRFA